MKSSYFQQVNAATELSPEYSTTGTTSHGGTGYSVWGCCLVFGFGLSYQATLILQLGSWGSLGFW